MALRWRRLGEFLGAHMVLIIPAFLVLGVAFPDVLGRMRPAVPTLFAVMTFQNALANNLHDLRRAFLRPGAVVVALLVMHVLFPLAAYLASGALFGFGSETVAGVVLEYSVPIGASSVMWVGLSSGDVPLMLATLLVSSLIAPFSIPATLQLLVGATVEVDALSLMADVSYMVAVPALVATLANELTHGRAGAVLRPPLMPLARMLLPIIVGTNATSIADELRHLTPELVGVTAFVGVCTVAGFLCGVLAGRLTRQPHARLVAVAFSCGIRNISVGAVLAATYFSPAVVFPAVIGTLFQQTLAALFGKWIAALAPPDADGQACADG